MNYVLDIASAAVLLICILAGSKKGAAGMIISAAGCIAAFAAAVFVSGAYDEYVYEKFVRPSVVSSLEKKADELSEKMFSEEFIGGILSENGIELDDEQISAISENSEELFRVLTNEEFRDKINSIFTNYCKDLTKVFSGILPEEITDRAEKFIEEKDLESERKLELLTFDKRSAAELVEREIIRPAVVKFVRTALFFVTFTAVSAIFAVISYIVRTARGIRAVRSADNTLGGVLGIFQGVTILVIVCTALKIFIDLTADGNSYINSGIIAKTVFFKWLYSGTSLLLSLILK